MKKWYLWLVLALVFAISGVINFFDGRGVTAQIVQVAITVFLAFAQLICDKRGTAGKRVFKYICIVLLFLLILWILLMLL